MTTTYRHLTSAILKEVLQSAGYRVTETKGMDGAPILTSATGGLPFEVRFFNPLTSPGKAAPVSPPASAGQSGTGDQPEPPAATYADAGFRAAFRVEGELPLALVNAWNATHRFARLNLVGRDGAPGGWLLLDMDVIALGGVLADNLRAHVEVWDRLIPELIAYLRVELPKLAKAAPVAEPAPAASGAEAEA